MSPLAEILKFRCRYGDERLSAWFAGYEPSTRDVRLRSGRSETEARAPVEDHDVLLGVGKGRHHGGAAAEDRLVRQKRVVDDVEIMDAGLHVPTAEAFRNKRIKHILGVD